MITLPIDNTTIASFLVGIFTPWLISSLLSPNASSRFKAWFTLAVCFVVQLVVTIIGRQFLGDWGANAAENARIVLVNFVAILASCWPSFARLWKPTGVTDMLEDKGIANVGGPPNAPR